MCQGTAAQALATLEALTDTNRRTLLSGTPLPADSTDSELADVYSELFMAAHEIISGLSLVTPHVVVACWCNGSVLD